MCLVASDTVRHIADGVPIPLTIVVPRKSTPELSDGAGWAKVYTKLLRRYGSSLLLV